MTNVRDLREGLNDFESTRAAPLQMKRVDWDFNGF